MKLTREILEKIEEHKNYKGNLNMLKTLHEGMRIKNKFREKLIRNGILKKDKR